VGSEYSKLLAEKSGGWLNSAAIQDCTEGQLLVEKWFWQAKLMTARGTWQGPAQELELEAKKAKGILKEEETIWAEYEAAVLKLEEDYSQKRQAIRDREIKNFGYVRTQGEEEINDLFRMEGMARDVAYNKAQEIIASPEADQKRSEPRKTPRRKSRNLQNPGNRDRPAKTASDQISPTGDKRRSRKQNPRGDRGYSESTLTPWAYYGGGAKLVDETGATTPTFCAWPWTTRPGRNH
jgi:hypothetical protein